MFTTKFDRYACENDTITCNVDGFDVTARIVRDDNYSIDDDDSHNPDTNVTGCNRAQQAKLLKARQAWKNDEWFYCGIVISVSRSEIVLSDHASSLWGIECNYPEGDNSYLSDVANELLPEAVETAEGIIERLLLSLGKEAVSAE